MQGKPVELRLRTRTPRWGCRNASCTRRTFAGHGTPLVAHTDHVAGATDLRGAAGSLPARLGTGRPVAQGDAISRSASAKPF